MQFGLDRLLADKSLRKPLAGKRVALLAHPASVTRELMHALDALVSLPDVNVTAAFGPQHGLRGDKQDNMIESPDFSDPQHGIPVFSLYGKVRRPTAAMMDSFDVLLVDLQDVGTRVYTFIYTLSYCLEAAAALNKKVVVLDRPNPINGLITEGNCLKPEWRSFVGRFPLPMRHGLTIGELAHLFNEHFRIGCGLEVIQMKGWRRSMFFHQTGLPWVPPSPNLPSPVSTMVYPGQVIWEGTNVSEGRGTTQPFEIFGAPYIDPAKIGATVGAESMPGIILREVVFEPTANKWSARPCRGFQIHVTDPHAFRPYETGLRLLQAVIIHHRDAFRWKPPPYEYETRKLPIDLIIGDGEIRSRLENLEPVQTIIESWQGELQEFSEISRRFHLYR